ncbi:MAG: SGNH/GDSL hydrolase family protein, partial [Clostridia bacterium]|nr:SGNH/GDSL hydrolase family protein [Clostridia bacterium]
MRILYLGNSITKHMPAPEIGWHGEWGMAASAPEKDYVRRMNALLEQAGKRVEWRAENAADFERAPEPFPEEAFRAYLAFAPDVVILRIGENVPDDIAEP